MGSHRSAIGLATALTVWLGGLQERKAKRIARASTTVILSVCVSYDKLENTEHWTAFQLPHGPDMYVVRTAKKRS